MTGVLIRRRNLNTHTEEDNMKTQRDGHLQARKKESDRILHSPEENQHSRHLGLRLNLRTVGK